MAAVLPTAACFQQPLLTSPLSKPSTPLSKKPSLPALQRTASESAAMQRGRSRISSMELGGLVGHVGHVGGGGGKLVHDSLFSPSGSVASDDSARRAFNTVGSGAVS